MSNKEIRLCLSGSGFRFPAHVGALAAVVDSGYEVIELSGTSGGSIVAAMYASGYKIDELHDITINSDFSKFIEFNISALFSFSWCSGKRLENFLANMIGKDTNFSQLKIPTKIIASDIRTSSKYVFGHDDENVVTAVRASSAVPFIYAPIKINNDWIVDGGIVSNVPIEVLTDDDVLKLGIKLTSDLDTTKIDSALDILGRSANLLFESNDRAHIEYGKMKSALFAFPNTGAAGSFDTKASKGVREKMYQTGYNETKKVLDHYQNIISRKRSFEHPYEDVNKQLYFK